MLLEARSDPLARVFCGSPFTVRCGADVKGLDPPKLLEKSLVIIHTSCR
jgi:hypothetical protein